MVLGNEEKCCGDAVRRTGNEYLFRQLAQQNIETFEKYNVKRIITHCPHCYNVFKNEYPHLGGQYEVVHHTQLIADLMRRGVIPAPDKEINRSLVYHDPCYLGRYNDIYANPRQILQSIPGLNLVEKDRCAENSLCCGAGGGGMWMTETGEQRISQVLFDQVMEKKPEMLATACPYCLTMLEDEAREKIAEHQRTFTLKKLVAKYGEEEGKRRWDERQRNWKEKVYNKNTCINGGISKAASSIFDLIKKEYVDYTILYDNDEKVMHDGIRPYKYDFCLVEKRKIIEFNGTYWHCDPRKYNADYYNKVKKMTAREIWEFDKYKRELALGKKKKLDLCKGCN